MKERSVGTFTLHYYFCRYVFIFVYIVSLLSIIPFEMALFCTNTVGGRSYSIGCKAIFNLRSELHYKD